jgi:hypothetical protein
VVEWEALSAVPKEVLLPMAAHEGLPMMQRVRMNPGPPQNQKIYYMVVA